MSETMQNGLAVAELNDREKVGSSPRGGSIGFWISDEGQALIESFGNWEGSTALSCWLAQSYPRYYGADAGLNNLWGQKNTSVAAFVQTTEIIHGAESPESHTLAAALNLYARDPGSQI